MHNFTPPKVTVITTTYNGARFLAATIESILNQSFKDFEYVIVDDASTDESQKIIKSYQKKDHRIRCIINPTNLGPPGALNKALKFAGGEYIAVLDHDDLALPERLERQVAFLNSHKMVGVVGGQARIIDENCQTTRRLRFTTSPAEAHWQLFFGVSLLHSAFMYRYSLIEQVGGYSEQHSYICDYELLVRMAERCQITNLPDELVCYRSSPTQISSKYRKPQSGQVVLFQYAIQKRWLNLRPDLSVFTTLLNWGHGHQPSSENEATKVMEFLEMLFDQYCATKELSNEEFADVSQSCSRRWLLMAHYTYKAQPSISRICWQKACELDPLILKREKTWDMLRKYRFQSLQLET
jgi:glycosyltransferase involved in cell wall biosynthesis